MTLALLAAACMLAGILWTVVCLAVSVALGALVLLGIWLFRKLDRDPDTAPEDQSPAE